ncbi:MAG: hypothetical protein O3C63_09160 [Cyanobacteria bacterium]|nr:hypothetical protein [Cyanobacteriota bacterium]MDA1021613.1 hypothetical protein [Cyanobacteriota bacterium]
MVAPVDTISINKPNLPVEKTGQSNLFEQITQTNRVSELFSEQPKKIEKKLDELQGWDKVKRAAKIWAKIFDSRASTYRAVMDLIGADIPTVIAGMRNIYSFIEQSIEAAESFIMVFAAPKITSWVSKIIGKSVLSAKDHQDTQHHLLFHRSELHDNEQFKQAIYRIRAEEVDDKKHIAELYRELGKHEKAKELDDESQAIRNYCDNFISNYNEQQATKQREQLLKLKESVQLAESFVEGGLWGSFGITMRLFRKYVLKQDSFTGTKGYANKEEQAKLGDNNKIGIKEIFGALVGTTISPIINKLVLNATRDRDKVKHSKWLSWLDYQFDMTHGLYPRLGMMFSFMVIPKWSSVFLTAQGRNELIEKLSKALSMIPLWWLGQKITNGPLAAMRDKQMQKEYGTEPGLLVNRPNPRQAGLTGWLKHLFPEAQKYYDIFKQLQNVDDPKLKEAAFDKHAKTLYQGLGLHTGIIFTAIMLSQFLTKLRVKKQLKAV